MKLYLRAWQYQMLELDEQALVQKPFRCSVEILHLIPGFMGEYGPTSSVESSLEELMDVN